MDWSCGPPKEEDHHSLLLLTLESPLACYMNSYTYETFDALKGGGEHVLWKEINAPVDIVVINMILYKLMQLLMLM